MRNTSIKLANPSNKCIGEPESTAYALFNSLAAQRTLPELETQTDSDAPHTGTLTSSHKSAQARLVSRVDDGLWQMTLSRVAY